jgi:uncharacterized repeat protein (TIGR03803 family)
MKTTTRNLARGRLCVALALVAGLCLTSMAQGQTYTVLHNFSHGPDGGLPEGGLTMDAEGNLYGTAVAGGRTGGNCGPYGCGTVFKLSSSLVLTPIYLFQGGTDGSAPGPAILRPNGTLYGVTTIGGGNGCTGSGCGTVFSLTPPDCTSCVWKETVLYRFTGGIDGSGPGGSLTSDASGNLYGTTGAGGAHGYGVVYELSPFGGGWTESVLYSFTGGDDGRGPQAGVIFDQSGNLYGTTILGGSYSDGTVFRLTPSGSAWSETTLHSFQGSDGANPYGGVILDQSGNFYGPAAFVGPHGAGTVYELTQAGGAWSLTVPLPYAFSISPGQMPGEGPGPTLAMDAAGNLYGTTYSIGLHDFGTVFKLTRSNGSWTETDLYDFTGGSGDGGYPSPYANVILDSRGNVYGTAEEGGTYDWGVIFKITP